MDDLKQQLIKKAIEEIEEANFGETQQFIEVHEIKRQEGVPVVARVDLTADDDTSIVYFNVEDEPFFFVVYMNHLPAPHVRWVGIENAYSVCLSTSSETLNASEMAELTILKPTKSWSKGDKTRTGERKFSNLIFEPNPEVDEFEVKLEKLLTYVEQDRDGIKKLVDNCNAYIQVASWLHVGTLRGYHLSLEAIKRMANLELVIDIDQYGTGNDYLMDETLFG